MDNLYKEVFELGNKRRKKIKEMNKKLKEYKKELMIDVNIIDDNIKNNERYVSIRCEDCRCINAVEYLCDMTTEESIKSFIRPRFTPLSEGSELDYEKLIEKIKKRNLKLVCSDCLHLYINTCFNDIE
jgi:hypothetical protein